MSDDGSEYDDDYQDDFDLDESLGESNTSRLSASNNNNNNGSNNVGSTGNCGGDTGKSGDRSAHRDGRTTVGGSVPRKETFRRENNLGVNPLSDVNADTLAPLTSTRSGAPGSSRSVSFATNPKRGGANSAASSNRQQQRSTAGTLASTSASQSNTTNTTYTDSTYSDTFESLQNTRSPSHPAAPPAIPLPRQILELRKQVEEYSKSGNKMQLLESLELLEAALVQHKIESSKTAESKKFRAREKQRRAEARRARHHQKFQQLRRESAENLRFRRENEDLLNQLQTAKELYESEKNSSKQLSNLASSRQSEIDIIKTASEELETKLSDVGSQVLQLGQDMKVKSAIEESLNKQISTLEKQATLNLDQLPERQVEIVRAEEERLKRWEGRLEDLDAKLGMREATLVEARARNIEIVKVEAKEEKLKAMAEVKAAQTALNNASREFENDRIALRETNSRSEAHTDAKRRVLSGEKMAFEALLKKFKGERLKFEIERDSFEPSLKALEDKGAAVEEAKRRIEEKAREIEKHNAQVRRDDMLLSEREEDLRVREESILMRERGAQNKEREIERRGTMLQKQLTNLQEARLAVHEQQLAVAKEVAEVKRALLALKVLEGRVEGREDLTVRTQNASIAPNTPSDFMHKGGNLKSIEALEKAIGRCTSSLDELTLRSRAAISEVAVPAERLHLVAAGVPPRSEAPPKPPTAFASPGRGTEAVAALTKSTTQSVTQLLGNREKGTSLGQRATYAAKRMRQATIANSKYSGGVIR